MKSRLTISFLLMFIVSHAQTPSIKEQPRTKSDESRGLTKTEIQSLDDNAEEGTYPNQLTVKMESEPAPYLKYYEKVLFTVNDSIRKLRKESLDSGNSKEKLDNLTSKIDSLKIQRSSLRRLNTLLSKRKNNYKKLFPTLTSDTDVYDNFFNELYDKDKDENLYLINNTSYQFDGSGGIIRSELVSAYLKGLRISLGTVVTTASNDEENSPPETPDTDTQELTEDTQAFKRLISGGNTYLDFELPVTLVQGNAWTFYWSANGRMNLAIDGFSSDLENTLFNSSVGSRIYSSVSSDDKEFIFYFSLNAGLHFGERSFYESLAVPNKGFLFGQLQVGVSVLQNLKLTFDVSTFSSEESLNSGRVIVGAQLLTDFLKK